MRLVPLLLGFFLSLILACSDDQPPRPRVSMTPMRAMTATPRPLPTATIAPSPTPWPELALQLLPAGARIEQAGAYLLETTTGIITRVGERGGRLSPDNRLIASGLCCLGVGYVDILDLQTGKNVRITTGDISRMEWSGDGTRLAYTVHAPDHLSGLYVVDREGRPVNQARLAGHPIRLVWLTLDAIALIHHDYTTDTRSYTLTNLIDGGISPLPTTEPIAAEDPRILLGTPSPTGDWVLSETNNFVWNRLSGEVRGVPAKGEALWSQSGNRLLVAGEELDGAFPVWKVLNLDTGQSVTVPDVGLWAQWAAGDTGIASLGYRCAGGDRIGGTEGRRDANVFDLRRRNTTWLTTTPDIIEFELAVSPDTLTGAFVIGDFPKYQLVLADYKTNTTSVVAQSDGFDIHVHGGASAWSEDSTILQFYVSGGHGICN